MTRLAHVIDLRRAFVATLAVSVLAAAAPSLRAAETEVSETSAADEVKENKRFKWDFNIDATWGAFGFHNSLYANNRPDEPSGDLSETWHEASVKPAVTGTYTSLNTWQFYMKGSVVGEGTYDAAPSLVGDEESSFDLEDFHVGWRSGQKFANLGENALELTVGRAPFQLGHGFLVYDGASEGGSRGGFWTNARKAFQMAGIVTFKPKIHTLQAFYLERDQLPEADDDSRLWGLNYEVNIHETNTIGVTYLNVGADEDDRPLRDGMDVFNFRAFLAPFTKAPGLKFEGEYAKEENGDLLESEAWNAMGSYEFGCKWKPRFSYRYAIFEGDDPTTMENESFDPLFLGFSDWGTWWQGEIAGEYFLSNSNLISNQFRVHVQPNDKIGTGLIYYKFYLDEPQTLDPKVTSDDVADEVDWYMDWKWRKHFTFSFVAAWADPGEAVQQAFDRTDDFLFGMAFVAFSY